MKRLFLVEDSSDDEDLSLRAIKKSGIDCEVTVARHGGKAIELLLSQETPKPDLVVLDFNLPGFNGLEILRQLRSREEFKNVPIVMLSSLDSNKDLTDCLAEGAKSCVQKASDPDVYLERVSMIVKYWLNVDKPPER